MNHNEEVPDFLGGLGDMLPADVLKKVIELLEQLHRAGLTNQSSKIELVYGLLQTRETLQLLTSEFTHVPPLFLSFASWRIICVYYQN